MVITAFQEAENVLIDRTKLGRLREGQLRILAALQRFRDLADLR
jgi:hypothetical protein